MYVFVFHDNVSSCVALCFSVDLARRMISSGALSRGSSASPGLSNSPSPPSPPLSSAGSSGSSGGGGGGNGHDDACAITVVVGVPRLVLCISARELRFA